MKCRKLLFSFLLLLSASCLSSASVLPVDWYYVTGFGQTGTDTYTIQVTLLQGSAPDGPYDFCIVGGGCATQTCTGGTCTGSGSVILSGNAPTHAGTGGPSDTTFNGSDYTWGGVAGTWSVTVRGVPNECFSDCLLYVGHNNNEDVVMSLPGATPTPGPTATPEARCGWSLDLSLVPRCPAGTVGVSTVVIKVDGVARYGPFSIPVGSGTIDGYYDGVDAEGTVVTVEMDGTTIKSNTVRCSGDPPPSNQWLVTASVGQVCNAPSPSPTASPAGTPYPTPTPPPGTPPPGPTPPGQTPPPHATPGPPTGTASASVAITNANDFYEPIRQAVRDSGNEVPTMTQSKAGIGDLELDSTAMDTMTGAITETTDQGAYLTGGLEDAKNAGDDVLANIDPNLESVGIISVPVTGWWATRLNITEFRLDFTQFDAGINILRTFVLWCMSFAFFVMTIRVVVYDS